MQTAQAAPQAGASSIPLPVEIVGVRVPIGSAERRNPIALVEVSFGELRVIYTVAQLRNRKREVRAPETPDRMEGVKLPASLAPLVRDLVHAAAMADPAARAVLTRPPLGKYVPH
jgi:hypothetical protein